MSETKGLCPTCSNSIFCKTWAEYKCSAKKRRIYGYETLTECKQYKKRPAGWKEMPCRCEDCLKNEMLAEEIEEVE